MAKVRPRWFPAIAGPLLGYLALGVWCDGYRNVIETAGHVTLYGVNRLTLLLFHTTLPLACVLVLAGSGIAVGVSIGAPLLAVPTVIVSHVFLIMVRLFDCAKGPMPISLLAPVSTPFGDLSGLTIAYWQADALVISVVITATIAMSTQASGAPWLLAFFPAALVIVWMTRRRLSQVE